MEQRAPDGRRPPHHRAQSASGGRVHHQNQQYHRNLSSENRPPFIPPLMGNVNPNQFGGYGANQNWVPTQPYGAGHIARPMFPIRGFHPSGQQPNSSGANANFNRPQNNWRGKSSNRGKQNATEYKEKFYRIGFQKLEELTREDPDQLIITLINDNKKFANLLNEDRLSDDYIVLIMRVIVKMCLSPFNQNKAPLLVMVCQEKFVTHLKGFMMNLPLQNGDDRKKSRYYWENPEDFWKNMCIYCTTILSVIPTTACDMFENEKFLKAITYTLQSLEISDDVREDFEELQKKLALHKEEKLRKKTNQSGEETEESEPIDDFRGLSLYPTSVEITTPDEAFLRKNVVEGAYRNVDHYLDVQFRLLREDFVAPLRKGVCDYLNQDDRRKRVQNIKVHQKVQFLRPELVNGTRGVLLQFEWAKKKPKLKYENSRKFMFGTLLCFTRNNFASLLFGKIIDRKKELLEKGMIIVGFEPGMDNAVFNINYLMVECKVYFEPYYHVLQALKTINEENFPMKEFLVDVRRCVEYPKYYEDSGTIAVGLRRVNVYDEETWPSSEGLRLNASQYDAFKTALTQKFAIIQGPPGTGKTYLGLRIAKTLIENHELWKDQGPMLVVCYTNHALDQFLEGLMDATRKIVRIGGQSKNQKLAPFNIKEVRLTVHRRDGNRALYLKRCDVEEKVRSLKATYVDLDAVYNYDGIIDFSCFVDLCPELRGTWFDCAGRDAMKKWLLGGKTREERREERLQFAVNRAQQNMLQANLPPAGNSSGGESDDDDDELFDALNRAENQVDIDDIFDVTATSTVRFVLKIADLHQRIGDLISLITSARENEGFGLVVQARMEEELQQVQADLEYLKMRLYRDSPGPHPNPTDVDLRSPEKIHPDDRWRLYFYWLDQYKKALSDKLRVLEEEYRELHREYEEVRSIEDCQIMKGSVVIGMTTTSAARLQTTLQALKCPIVIVEEAAEILEAHIIASLTNHCQHLILIGDHQQLRPSTADYNVEKNYLLGISLFERMIKNNIHCNVLNVQHRMRPEIARLIVPAVYPKLANHPSVNNFPTIKGVDSCLYFITHNHQEELSGENSKSNLHEAKFLLQLARYLILNGYEPEDITILAAYSAQMFTFWRERKHIEVLKDVRITVLDNYQGEESRIILLSLVRNNGDGSIGFLSIQNRVCVALSRAKEGFYMMGNIDLLANNSQIWPKVRGSLEAQNAVGTTLNLRCQIHQLTMTPVQTADDFNKVSEGGCSEICAFDLACGHTCVSQCHILDRGHIKYKCKEKCMRFTCKFEHPCPKLCHEKCGQCEFPISRLLNCGHVQDVPCHKKPEEHKCQVWVSTELPCKHTAEKPCHRDAATFPCPHPCDTRIEICGHACRYQCHIRDDPDHLQYKCLKPCAKYRVGCTVKTEGHFCTLTCSEECQPCTVKVKKHRTVCPHVFTVPCNEDVDELICRKPCLKTLPCGHKCKLECGEACGNCAVKVEKIVPDCNHKVNVKCNEEPTRAMCKGKCTRTLPCGHECGLICKDKCREKCMFLIDNPFEAECGHIFKIPCHLRNEDLSKNVKLLQYCREPCATKLECEHNCTGSCGECHQGRIHKSCQEKCGSTLVCGHECSVPCRQTCQPCNLPCNFRCVHSKCKKKCGEPCTPCTENCPRRCAHVTCRAKKCSDKCTVPPCTEPCGKTLRCGHPCVGFCNDPCPPLCRVCDKRELTEEFFLGYEEEEDARFVLLKECGHVIESRGMEQWLRSGGDQINVKRCPRCNTPLSFTQRYSDHVKESITDITNVKRKFYGMEKDNERIRVELLKKLNQICDSTSLKNETVECSRVKEKLEKCLQPVRNDKRQKLHTMLANTFASKIQIYQQICELYHKCGATRKSSKCVAYVDFLLRTLTRQEDRITNQEIQDFERELKRLRRMLQLCVIEERTNVASRMEPRVRELYLSLLNKLYSAKKYKDEDDGKIKERLVELANKTSSGLAVSDEELQAIVKAVGVQLGAWYKCPNGHPYAIGECGGAMQLSKCIECGAQIGGQSHQLAQGNAHANIDRSRHAAWSDAANMANYQFE